MSYGISTMSILEQMDGVIIWYNCAKPDKLVQCDAVNDDVWSYSVNSLSDAYMRQ